MMVIGGSTAAAAQYQWRDTQGRMVFSDLPPPPSIAGPTSGSTAGSGSGSTAGSSAESTAGSGAASKPGSAAPAATDASLSIADREMAYRKRIAERAEEEDKAADASRRKLELARACTDAHGDIRSLESGQRISRITAAGEREFLSDAERAERLAVARKNVGERC